MQHPLSVSSRMQAPATYGPPPQEGFSHQIGQPAPRKAPEALTEGIRLALTNWRQVLLITVLGWAPGELVRALTFFLPLSPPERLLGSLASLALTLLGIAFVSIAVVGLLARPARRGAPLGLADRALLLSGRRLWELWAFGLLVACWMAPLGLASMASFTLLNEQGHCLLAHGISMLLSFFGTLQCQGAAVGLALLYADACADGGLTSRLGHLARYR